MAVAWTCATFLHVVGLLSGPVVCRSACVHLLSGSGVHSAWGVVGERAGWTTIAASRKLVIECIVHHVHVMQAALYEVYMTCSLRLPA